MNDNVNTAETPVLLIAWRRPQTLRLVIEAIRPVSPKWMFVACDGPDPSRPGEVEKVAETRALIDQEIDWACTIQHFYSEENLGCSLGVSRAISWFFDQVEEGIILEDDCVPHTDFFIYCSDLLNRYRADTRVWCISGSNFQSGNWRGDGSYYFSRYNHCWGWASWRRCWKHYDGTLSTWPSLRDSGLLRSMFTDPKEILYWSSIWQKLFIENKPDSWAYRWTFTCFVNGGLTALPNVNLVSNIGFGEDATHTTGSSSLGQSTSAIGLINPPKFILRDATADRFTFERIFSASPRPNIVTSTVLAAKRLVRSAMGALSDSV